MRKFYFTHDLVDKPITLVINSVVMCDVTCDLTSHHATFPASDKFI